MKAIIDQVPKDLINFFLVTIFSLLIGLEQRRRIMQEEEKVTFGTDRTFAFAGILGYILFIISPNNLYLFLSGGAALAILLSIFYAKKIEKINKFGITNAIALLITYSLPILIYTKPLWLTLLIVTTLLTFSEKKELFVGLTKKFSDMEFITAAKFLVITGVILPLLPDKIIANYLPFSPFKIWLVVVVVSAISYISYLLHKFFIPNNGLIVTGFLGGLYSSTATTFVLARKSKESQNPNIQYSAAIMLATSMMFLRIYILATIFSISLAHQLLLPFAILFTITILSAFIIYRISLKQTIENETQQLEHNPLEFKTALIFAILFVAFGAITQFVLTKFGSFGLNWLSLIVGVTDIDPFLLSLFTGKYAISSHAMATAALIAITSNNLLKMIYSILLGSKAIRKTLIIAFTAVIIGGIVSIFFL